MTEKRIRKEYSLSVKNLAQAYPDGKLFTGQIETTHSGGKTYYDLYNHKNELACMDGETVELVELKSPMPMVLVLENKNGEEPVRFMLTPNEFSLATYFDDANYSDKEREAIIEIVRQAGYNIHKDTIKTLLSTETVTINKTPDGRKVVWLVDDNHDIALYVDTLNPLSAAEVERLT